MIDFMLKASSREAFEKDALARGWLRENGEGGYSPAPGVDIDHIGPVMTTLAVLDKNGGVVEPAEFDTDHHVNVRLSGEMEQAEKAGKPSSNGKDTTTATGEDFAEKSQLVDCGKADGWKVEDGKGEFVARLKTNTVITPWRVWQ